jgi:hypothetical protein
MATTVGRRIVRSINRSPSGGPGKEPTMNGPDVTEITAAPRRRACLVEGCTCKDARILSTRRADYFASIAASRGETADRRIAADDDTWRLPNSPALEATWTLAAFDLVASDLAA